VFLRAAGIDTTLYWELRRLPGFLRYLECNTNIVPLNASDAELLGHFLSFGEVVGSSQVYFDDQRRIRVTAGPLRGMEGRIVKVDRRKGRARVRLELYRESFLIDFGFQALEPATEPATSAS
jgi:transcriptional antiterminator NusG